MFDDAFKIVNEKYGENFEGQALLINMSVIPDDFNYIALWYVLDGNENTSLTTELYFSNEAEPVKPENFCEEIKENNFKQFRRFILPLDKKWVWLCSRIDSSNYCDIKTGEMKSGKTYLNYKLIQNKASSFDVLKSGVIKGSQAFFKPVFFEDKSGVVDYKDAVIYLVFIKDLPPPDWNIDHYSLGIEGVPIINNSAKIPAGKKYSDWLGIKNPFV